MKMPSEEAFRSPWTGLAIVGAGLLLIALVPLLVELYTHLSLWLEHKREGWRHGLDK